MTRTETKKLSSSPAGGQQPAVDPPSFFRLARVMKAISGRSHTPSKLIDFWLSLLRHPVENLPILGPALLDGGHDRFLLGDLLATNSTILPYDKKQRWYTKNPEIILSESIMICKNNTIIMPLISTKSKEITKFYIYSDTPVNVKSVLKTIHKTSLPTQVNRKGAKIYFNHFIQEKQSVRIIKTFLKTFGPDNIDYCDSTPKKIQPFTNLPEKVRETIQLLEQEPDLHSFPFLSQPEHGKSTLCFIEDERIVGLIGPMDTLADHTGKRFLCPPYFAVSASYRRRGIGTTLWQKAMDYANKHNARYLLLQTESNTPADSFYQSVGCTDVANTPSMHLSGDVFE